MPINERGEFVRERSIGNRVTSPHSPAPPPPNPSPSSGGTWGIIVIVIFALFVFSLWKNNQQPRQEAVSAPAPQTSIASPLQMGTVTTCQEATGWGRFVPKSEFLVTEPICVYAEALNVNRNHQIDITFTATLKNANKVPLVSKTIRSSYRNNASSCWQNWKSLKLPANASPGTYYAEVTAHNNITNQIGVSSSRFTLVEPLSLSNIGTQLGSQDLLISGTPDSQTEEQAARIDSILEGVDEKINKGDYEGANAQAEHAAKLYPHDEGIRTLLQRTRTIKSIFSGDR